MSFSLEDVPLQKGKIAIITGANTGLGYETTLGLAQKEVKVIMACRNERKAENAKSQIKETLPDADLDIQMLDLSSLSSVHAFAEYFKHKYDKLDLLINNAGVMYPPYSKTKDGFELQFGVNYLGHFLLTALLLDHMPDTSDSRIVTVSSKAHESGIIHFDDLQFEKKYSRQDAYAQSKLACLMFADELDRRLQSKGKNLLSVSAHPGVSITDLGRHIPAYVYVPMKYTVMRLISHSPQKGALPTLLAALDPNVQGGDYYGPQGFMGLKGEPGKAKRSKEALNIKTAQKLWEVSEQLTSQPFSITPE